MKILRLLAIGLVILLTNAMQAQLSVHLNIGTPPAWGPAGYSDVDYYYLPDVEAYYDIRSSMFIYYSGNAWVHRSYLPSRYRGYDLYRGYKVPMSGYHGNSPYYNHQNFKMKYAKGYRGHEQHNIGQKSSNRSSSVYRQSENRSRQDVLRGNDRKVKSEGHSNNGKGKKK